MKQTKTPPSPRHTVMHPGEVLFNQFMQPVGMTANRLAKALRLTSTRVGEIIDGRRGITAESALRLSRFFGNTADFWLHLQADYDLSQAEKKWAQIINAEILPLAGPGLAKQGKSQKQGKPPVLPNFIGHEKKVFALISDDPIHFDVLCDKSGLPAGQLSATLTVLQLYEAIRRHAGDYYSK